MRITSNICIYFIRNNSPFPEKVEVLVNTSDAAEVELSGLGNKLPATSASLHSYLLAEFPHRYIAQGSPS
jgi:hypothetical protein